MSETPLNHASGLTLKGVSCFYGSAEVVQDVDLHMPAGHISAIVGPNGAGKSSLLAAIMGFGPRRQGCVYLDDAALPRDPKVTNAAGIALVPEGRRVFAERTVEANLLIAGWQHSGSRSEKRALLASVYQRFPVLEERRASLAGSLSGGQAQMLAIGMALMTAPRVLLLDEPCLGLAPIIVNELFHHVVELKNSGICVVLVEQSLHRAISVSQDLHLMNQGRIVHSTRSDKVEDIHELARQYLV